jgi:tetratricopeptide (TPR) repeat protein
MSNSWEDEETWEEDRHRRFREPLEIRFSIQQAKPGNHSERGADARQLLSELLDIPQAKRQLALKRSKFHEPCLLELLLECGHAALPFEPHQAVELTILAADLGSLLNPHGTLEIAEGLSRALCLLGTAQRLVGDLAAAEVAFERASRLGITPTERGLFCRALALLRWDQGRTEEAVALLSQSSVRFAEALDFQELAVCRALSAQLCLEEGLLHRAAADFCQAAQDFTGFSRPWLAAQTWLGLALCYADNGKMGKARSARQRAWAFLGQVKDERALLNLHWLEGRVAHLLGDLADAEALLEDVRRQLMSRWRFLPETTLVTLDLGLLWMVMGKEHKLGPLLDEIALSFAGMVGLDLALDSLVFDSVDDPAAEKLRREILKGMAPMLRLAFRLQGLLQPVFFA